MTEINAIFDIDITLKLTACDIWDEVLQAYDVHSVYRLDSAVPRSLQNKFLQSHRKRKLESKTLFFDDRQVSEIIKKLTLTITQTVQLPSSWKEPAEATKNELKSKSIDAGEAEATALLLAHNDLNLLLSGDKHFFTDLKHKFPDYYFHLRGENKLVSFESCLAKLCKQLGYDRLQPKLWQGRFIDKALMVSLGSQGQHTEQEFLQINFQSDPLNPD
ncbi:MAG: hypothetical protein QM537_01350 [Candidatus Symbiobacter sp.]|nr:hypothetical protein [Candidatus Symbiobacter sp.]